ncbi:MAG TPA: monovalent cation/H(+) antiporter subunit G [Noviherbaspirillum sp.]|nr:monovalent cation/H(+) antiporter subunit G [Noviherbaspirillum sp.]
MMTVDLPIWAALPVSLLLVAGGLLAVIGSLGLLRLPGFESRMHGPTMGNTLGIGCILLALVLAASAQAHRPLLQPLLIAPLVVLGSPATALLLIQAGIFRNKIKAGGAVAGNDAVPIDDADATPRE